MIFREIFREILLTHGTIVHKFDKVLAGFQITLPQIKTIDFIYKSGTCTLTDISRYLSIKKPPVTRMINCLEEKGFVEQVTGRDKREKRIALTISGKQLSEGCRATFDEIERRLVSGISDDEQESLLKALMTIRDNFDSWCRSE